MTRPFEGIRIIDATHVLAGPFAAYQLGLLGADVIKIEHPNDPDQSRVSGGDWELNRAGMGSYYLTQGSNKRSMTLDLKQDAAREIFRKLIAGADVLVENFRPGAFAALGLGYEDLLKINPRLIYCSISAFGHGGPRGEQTAYDHVIQATSGIMACTGTPEVNPIKFGAPAIDYATGTMGAFALSAALFQREKTGQGQHIDLAMLDVAIMMMASHVTTYARSGKPARPRGNDHEYSTNSCYETADGLVMIGASNLRQQRRLWHALGRPDMAKDSNEARHADRASHGWTGEARFALRVVPHRLHQRGTEGVPVGRELRRSSFRGGGHPHARAGHVRRRVPPRRTCHGRGSAAARRAPGDRSFV